MLTTVYLGVGLYPPPPNSRHPPGLQEACSNMPSKVHPKRAIVAPIAVGDTAQERQRGRARIAALNAGTCKPRRESRGVLSRRGGSATDGVGPDT